jgi:predicted outer membrane protein
MQLTVIGVGHVGLVTAACLASDGHHVVGLDDDGGKMAGLQAGRIPFHEPGLAELVETQVAAGRLRFTGDLADALAGAEVAFVCVGTPALPGGGPNLRFVETVGRNVGELATDDVVLVEKSTVPANTGIRLQEVVARRESNHGDAARVGACTHRRSEIQRSHERTGHGRLVVTRGDGYRRERVGGSCLREDRAGQKRDRDRQSDNSRERAEASSPLRKPVYRELMPQRAAGQNQSLVGTPQARRAYCARSRFCRQAAGRRKSDMRRRTVLLGLGAAMMASSVAMAQTDTLQRSGIRVRKDASLDVSYTRTGVDVRTPSYAGGDVDIYAGWTDGNIIHYLIVGDSMEVEIARLAETRSGSAAVRDLARMLASDHTAYLAEDLEMNRDEDLGRVPSPNDMTLSRLTNAWNELRGLSGAAFDRAFLRQIAAKHQSSIAAYRALEPNARDDDLEKLLEDRIPLLERHLNRTRDVAATLGVNLNITTGTGQTTGSTRYPN